MSDRSDDARRRRRWTPAAILDRLISATAVGIGEMLLAVLLVLGLSLVMMGVLIVAFPEGTGLIDFYGELVDRDRSGSDLQVRYRTPREGWLALLTRVTRRVRDRPADAVAWRDARSGERLGEQHTVQTLARSGAGITFEKRSRLQLGENSLVVIKDNERRRGFRRPGASLVLLGGHVSGSVSGSEDDARPLDIVTVGGTTQIRGDEESPAEFNVKVNDDESTTYAIYAGTARVTSAGETISVGPDEWVTVRPNEIPGLPVPIPSPPRPRSPDDGATLTHGVVAGEVDFSWSGDDVISGYRLVVARDPGFDDVVFDGELRRPHFAHGNLGAGRYFWRVSGFEDTAETPFGPTRSLEIVRDVVPPLLDVEIPAEVRNGEWLILEGRTEPGAEVFVGDEVVPTAADGRFEHTLQLGPGLNHVVVEAVDAAGNSVFRSRYVNARFQQVRSSR